MNPSPRPSEGFSLVEVMVALAVGMILLTVLAVVFANSSRSQREITMAGQQIENGRYAMDLMADDIRHAGYYGYYSGSGSAPGSLPDPCTLAVATLRTSLVLPVQGYDSPAASPISCIDSANLKPNTDVLVIRRASTATTAAASLVGNIPYIQSAPSSSTTGNPVVALGSSAGSFTLTVRNGSGVSVAAPIRQLQTHIYYIAKCSTPTGSGNTVCTSTDDGGTPIPTLKRVELTVDSSGAISMQTYPLVEGIENLQIEYGLDSDADGAPDATYVNDPTSVANWQNVMAMRLYVLARNTQTSAGYTDNKTYTLGSITGATTVTPADSFRRHVFTAAVRLKNPSERKETP